MTTSNGRSWKAERASVSAAGKSRPRSNKYSGGDPGKKPAPGSRKQVWVGGYTRADGTKVGGHYRATVGHGRGEPGRVHAGAAEFVGGLLL